HRSSRASLKTYHPLKRDGKDRKLTVSIKQIVNYFFLSHPCGLRRPSLAPSFPILSRYVPDEMPVLAAFIETLADIAWISYGAHTGHAWRKVHSPWHEGREVSARLRPSAIAKVGLSNHRLPTQQAPVTNQRFDIVIIGIRERYVDFTIMWYRSHAIFQNEPAVGAWFGLIRRRRKAFEDPLCTPQVVALVSAIDISSQFDQCRSHDCCC